MAINSNIRIEKFQELPQDVITELVSDKNHIEQYFDDITYTFRKYCDKIAPVNKEPMCMFWYIFLSQFFKNDIVIMESGELITPRLSGILIQSSRTGKNYSSDKILAIAKKTRNISIGKASKYTENAIIGMPIDANIKHNDTKGLQWGVDKDAKNPFRAGMMENFDIVLMEEGKTLFTGGNKENLTKYMQEITDEKGEVTYSSGAGYFNRYTDCSFMITSVPFENDKVSKIIDDGFFQRFMLINNIWSNKDIKEFKLMKAKKGLINTYNFEQTKEMYYGKDVKKEDILQYKLSPIEIEEYTKLFANELNKIRTKLKSKYENKKIELETDKSNISVKDDVVDVSYITKRPIQIEFGSKAYVDKIRKINYLIDKYKSENFGDSVEKIDSFEYIMQMITTKIAGINCYLSGRTEIISNDVDIGFNYAKLHFDGICRLLGSLESKNNKENVRYANFIGPNWKSEQRVLRMFIGYNKQTKENSMQKIDELVRKNYIEMKEDEKTGEIKYRCIEGVSELLLSEQDYDEIVKTKSKGIKEYESNNHINLLVKYMRYLENGKVSYDLELFKVFSDIFYPDNSYNKPYALNNKLRKIKILPTNKNKWHLYDEINEHIGDEIQFTVLEEELFMYLSNYQDYYKYREIEVKAFDDEWNSEYSKRQLEEMNDWERENAIKMVEKEKSIVYSKICEKFAKNKLVKIPTIIKNELTDISHLEMPKKF